MKFKVLNSKEAEIQTPRGRPFRVYDDGGDVATLVEWMYANTTLTLAEYKAAKANEGEETCPTISIAA